MGLKLKIIDDMKLSFEAIKRLKHYIMNDEVVYQECDNLMEISNNENPDNRQYLLGCLNREPSIKVCGRLNLCPNTDFTDLTRWSTKGDVLIFMEASGILMCLPYKSAIESKIIEN